jgi:lipase maturation factor 1
MRPEGTTPSDGKSSFVAARWIFLRVHGAILVIAFVSLWAQIHGLVGERGFLPAQKYVDAIRQAIPATQYYFDYPMVFYWIGASDTALSIVCALGAIAGLAVVFGRFMRAALIAAWILYLSLSTICRVFLGFQWDILLLESTITTLFLASPTPGIGAFGLNRFLLFKLVFSSGAVKLLSGDETWRNWTALNYHYETQPLPTVLGWWAHQLPAGFQELSVAFTFFVQIIVPFFLFFPRMFRLGAVALLIGHQLLIAATGNYCFFNLIALALCVLFIDDAVFARLARKLPPLASPLPRRRPWLEAPRAVVLAILIVANGSVLAHTLELAGGDRAALVDALASFRSINGYGLFRVMTTARNEIIIEGSNDGTTWLPYEFEHKPGELSKPPTWVAPHQPRLDWQMWFAALGNARQNPWFQAVLLKLFEGSPEALALFARNPFPEAPPRYLRAELYLYHFTTIEEREATGNWWKREYLNPYFPVVQNNVRGSPP